MHAYTIIGENSLTIKESEKLASELAEVNFMAEVLKIEELKNFLSNSSLSHRQKTAYILTNFDKASQTTQNAFLKRLEEPNENIFYIITAENEEALLPTILSRVKIKRINNNSNSNSTSVDFLELDTTEKLEIISKIKKREDAISFTKKLLSDIKINNNLIKYLEAVEKTYIRLQANGNASLQLTNLVASLDQ